MIAAEQDGVLESLEDELFRFERTVDGNPTCATRSPTARGPAGQGRRWSRHCCRARRPTPTVQLARQAVLHPRGRRLAATLELYMRRGRGPPRAGRRPRDRGRAAQRQQHDRLVAALTAMFGRPVQLNVDVDPAIMGGIRIQIGDEVLDGSILGRLDEARRRLAG